MGSRFIAAGLRLRLASYSRSADGDRHVRSAKDDSYNQRRSSSGENDVDHAANVRLHVLVSEQRLSPVLADGQHYRYWSTNFYQQILVAQSRSEDQHAQGERTTRCLNARGIAQD